MGNVPELRFSEFSGEWEEVKLGERLKIGSGKDYKHLEKGDIPVYGTGGYMTAVNEYLYDGESVCIGRKGTIDKPMYLKGKFWTVDTLFFTYAYHNISPKFLYNIFLRINWQKYNEASGVPSLSKKTIEKIKVHLPSLPEQQKIADFLTAIDEKITILTDKIAQLETYKKGMMQKLLGGELRFPGFTDVWREVKLGEMLTIERGASPRPISAFVTNQSDGINWIKIGDIKEGSRFITDTEERITKDGALKSRKIVPGDFVLSNSMSFGRPYISKIYGCIHDGWLLMRNNKKDTISNTFLYEIMSSEFVKRQLLSMAAGSAVKNLKSETVKQVKIPLPTLPEQQKIADFLTTIDDKLTIEQEKLNQLNRYKQGLLQKMFV